MFGLTSTEKTKWADHATVLAWVLIYGSVASAEPRLSIAAFAGTPPITRLGSQQLPKCELSWLLFPP